MTNIKEKLLEEVMEDKGTWWIHSDRIRKMKSDEFKARFLTDGVEFSESIELAIDLTLAEVGKSLKDFGWDIVSILKEKGYLDDKIIEVKDRVLVALIEEELKKKLGIK